MDTTTKIQTQSDIPVSVETISETNQATLPTVNHTLQPDSNNMEQTSEPDIATPAPIIVKPEDHSVAVTTANTTSEEQANMPDPAPPNQHEEFNDDFEVITVNNSATLEM